MEPQVIYAFWGALIGAGMSLAGGLLGGGKPKIDTSTYDQAQSWLANLYNSYQNPFYEGNLQQMIQYFTKGGTATETNRQKAFSQVLAPINRMIPDERTRNQNAMARAGIITPGTVQTKMENDLATQAAYLRGQAIEGVNQRFDERLDQNKALAMSSSQNMAQLLKQLSLQTASTSGQMALQEMQQQLARSSMGTNWGQMLGGLGSSMLTQGASRWFGGGGAAGGGTYGSGGGSSWV